MSHAERHAGSKTGKPRASVFDIRNIIGALLFIYGVVLLIVGLVGTSAAEKTRAGGVNANLWVGIALAVVGALFIVWAVTRPIVVDETQIERDDDRPAH
ncbi:MAG: myelin proteolipid family protein [Actinomycetota bacterium]|nr:myelin proteolipid family protein [Actinomycetota bacterium]